MKAISEYGKVPLKAGDGVDNTKGDAEVTFMKLKGSMPCVGVGVKSIVLVPPCKVITGSNWVLFRAGVIGRPWHMSGAAAFDFTSLGKQSNVAGGEGVKSNNIAPLPKVVSKVVSNSMGCCGVEFLDGGVRASESEEADEKLPAVDGQEEGHERGWLPKL